MGPATLAGVAESEQEFLVREILRRCLGTLYLFEPDEYEKGAGATREPADLVWWCRDVLVLIAMTAGGRSYLKQNRHNLNQLRGFLRRWELGAASLFGANDWQTLAPDPHGGEDIVLLSVVSCPDARAEVHTDGQRPPGAIGQRVTLIASVPDLVLARILELGGSALDLADFLLRVSQHSGGVTTDAALGFVDEQFEGAAIRARAKRPTARKPELDSQIEDWIVKGWRTQFRQAAHNATAHQLRQLAFFTDIDREVTLHLSMLMADCFEMVRDVPVGTIGPKFVVAKVESPPYGFVVAVGDQRDVDEMSKRASTVHDELAQSGLLPFVVNLILIGRPEVEFHYLVFAMPRDDAPSATAATFRVAGVGVDADPE